MHRLNEKTTPLLHVHVYAAKKSLKLINYKRQHVFDIKKTQIIILIIYPENCSIQIALVKTFNRFPYCTESRKVPSYYTGLRNVISYCTDLSRGVPDRTTFARWLP